MCWQDQNEWGGCLLDFYARGSRWVKLKIVQSKSIFVLRWQTMCECFSLFSILIHNQKFEQLTSVQHQALVRWRFRDKKHDLGAFFCLDPKCDQMLAQNDSVWSECKIRAHSKRIKLPSVLSVSKSGPKLKAHYIMIETCFARVCARVCKRRRWAEFIFADFLLHFVK